MLLVFFFFFFKQKTAYEMRISDWSSDVCSSDLGGSDGAGRGVAARRVVGGDARRCRVGAGGMDARDAGGRRRPRRPDGDDGAMSRWMRWMIRSLRCAPTPSAFSAILARLETDYWGAWGRGPIQSGKGSGGERGSREGEC